MSIEEKIIESFEKTIVQMIGSQGGPEVNKEIEAYNEGIIDSFTKVSEVIEDYKVDIEDEMIEVKIPTLPISAIFEMELAREKGLQIWELFDKAKENKHEEWAQWTLANSNLVAAAWITERYDIL